MCQLFHLSREESWNEITDFLIEGEGVSVYARVVHWDSKTTLQF